MAASIKGSTWKDLNAEDPTRFSFAAKQVTAPALRRELDSLSRGALVVILSDLLSLDDLRSLRWRRENAPTPGTNPSVSGPSYRLEAE